MVEESKEDVESIYERARQQLLVELPHSMLPGRQDEYNYILNFLESTFDSESGRVLYISGTPGTGKTVTVTNILKYFKEKKSDKFVDIYVNGLSLSHPKNSYIEVWKHLSGDTLVANKARELLLDLFRSGTPIREKLKLTKKFVVLVLDEVDFLRTKAQDVLYDFFDCANLPQSKFIVIGISNTNDLPERCFKPKIVSRLGLNRIIFSPYNEEKLLTIIKARLGEKYLKEIFREGACELIARKIAYTNSDVRKALQLVKKCLFLTEEDAKRDERILPVTIQTVSTAYNLSISDPLEHIVPNLSEHEKLFICALIKADAIQTKDGLLTVSSIMHYHAQFTHSLDLKPITPLMFNSIYSSLETLGIFASHGDTVSVFSWEKKISIVPDKMELRSWLKDDSVAAQALGREFFARNL
uniref:Origin recognition complex subunit 1 n=1 Tax=Arcella intermedia TaxID=1963864 RepID=A0A6B2L3P9_9EUKA